MSVKEYSWQQNELGEYSYVEVKRKRKIPSALVSGVVALAVTAAAIAAYTVFILPHIRPQTVINQTVSENAAAVPSGDSVSFAGLGEQLADSIVAIPAQTTGGGFFSQMISSSGGSGVIVSADGYILTSNSAIDGSSAAKVRLSDGSEHTAEVVGIDSRNDCAVLKINKTDLKPVEFADSDSVVSGMSVASVGRILNEQLGTTLTVGTIGGVSRGVTLQNGQSINLLQTTAATDSSAGSILINSDGKVVGIVTTMISSGVDGIHFAIPSNDAVQVLESLINYGVAPSGLVIGIMGLDSDYGIIVESVSEGSAADKGGMKAGDLIMKADGVVVKTISELNKLRDAHSAGDVMTFTVYRDGETVELSVTLG
ncbi:MAG: trypsin-like peptidase domain-containing protein [Clostridia bacterium]|nr:trypsin-like peptidase domain-containing protein [Clostridia bacterium]